MIQKPKTVKKGDLIAVVSPAGAVEHAQIQSTLDLIKEYGYQPVLSPHALGRYEEGYAYSGTEEERISDLNWAFSNPSFSAIWATRGGYGCQHLLRHLKMPPLKKMPKWYIGYSDNTVIQSLLLKNNIASIHGQTLKTSSFGVTAEAYPMIFSLLEGQMPHYQFQHHHLNQKGEAQGILVGGNLALIYALLGTPYSFNFKDKILFIEDIGEQFYALDRMLMALDLAGVFRKIKGLVVGGMTNMGSEKDNPAYEASFDDKAYQIIAHRLKDYDFPIIYGFPNGHIYENLPLVIGAEVRMKVSPKAVSLTYQ
ncbi:S66 peptidase family protein [Riemerella columbina]|uniref:S66 peptidase family protein n=1 Tax=Riemerella columbina TaxID=103810 RepID=UPI00266F5797|nr:LD-carboxypeptidase [Riemerella columbina]WKS95212.1 LD-carboxypeptidase [Riemerella columbina]